MRAALIIVTTGLVACSQTGKGLETTQVGSSGTDVPTGTTDQDGTTIAGTIAGGGYGGAYGGGTSPGTAPDAGATGVDTGLGGADTGLLAQDELCDPADTGLVGVLDGLQTEGDSKVIYCHSAAGTDYDLVETDISSCHGHEQHAYDVLPSTGCDS